MASDRAKTLTIMALTFVFVVAACSGDNRSNGERLPLEEARSALVDRVESIGPLDDYQTRSATVEVGSGDLADTLPPISESPILVEAPPGADVVAEVFVTGDLGGNDASDGWFSVQARRFNESRPQLGDGRTAAVSVRRINSGQALQYIRSGTYLPDGWLPAHALWGEMAAVDQKVTTLAPVTLPNPAGLVLRTQTADQIRQTYGTVDPATLTEAVIAGDVVMGYTNPFQSSTGLNFLVTVLDSFAEGDETRLLAPDVASAFEEFQQRVPAVALTTFELRESVESGEGSYDALIMEHQSFVTTESLRTGYEFIPFGFRHDNPFYAVGDPDPAAIETLELLSAAVLQPDAQQEARSFGFEPPAHEPNMSLPTGQTLLDAQALWKQTKEGGRPLAVVFVVDVSGSMEGARLSGVTRALLSASGFVNPEAKVGVVEFNDVVRRRLPVEEFDLGQQSRFAAIVEDMEASGGTAMYDGVLTGLDMLLAERDANPETRLRLIVLSDGETTDGYVFDDAQEVIAGLRIPVITVGYEADLDELQRLSNLVEAASIDANQQDVEYVLSDLFNASI